MSDAEVNAEVDRVRQRLLEVSDELRGLQPDDFEDKHRLNLEADALRKELGALTESNPDTVDRWANQAGSKGPRSIEREAQNARAAILKANNSQTPGS